jgi:outer membrane autotransporter protein
MVLAIGAGQARAQTVSDNCTTSGPSVTCSGDVGAGIQVSGDKYTNLLVNNVAGNITPPEGTAGIAFSNGNAKTATVDLGDNGIFTQNADGVVVSGGSAVTLDFKGDIAVSAFGDQATTFRGINATSDGNTVVNVAGDVSVANSTITSESGYYGNSDTVVGGSSVGIQASGDTASITSTGAISATGSNAQSDGDPSRKYGGGAAGIFAQGDSAVSVTHTGDITATAGTPLAFEGNSNGKYSGNAIGIAARTYSGDLNVVTSGGTITATAPLSGGNYGAGAAAGIYAFSNSSDGGNAAVNNQSDIVVTSGSLLGFGRGDSEFRTVSGGIVLGGNTAAVTNTGAITLNGFGSGILATSSYGNTTITNAGDIAVTGPQEGKYSGPRGGALSFTNAGLLATSYGGPTSVVNTGTINVTSGLPPVDDGGIITFAPAPVGRTSGIAAIGFASDDNLTSADVSITTQGDVTLTNGSTLNAFGQQNPGTIVSAVTAVSSAGYNFYSPAGTATVRVDGANITGEGAGVNGIFASSAASTITLVNGASVTVSGDGTSGIIVAAQSFPTDNGGKYGGAATSDNLIVVGDDSSVTSTSGTAILDLEKFTSGGGIRKGEARVVDPGQFDDETGLNVATAPNNTTVQVAGTVTGGGGTAVALNGGDDTVVLQSGFNITGLVDGGTNTAYDDEDAAPENDLLTFGGAGTATFDVSLIGDQYLNFERFQKQDSGTFTLTGSNDEITALPVLGGALFVNGSIANADIAVSGGATLGGAGTVGSFDALNGATITPGNPGTFGTLSVAGNTRFAAGSTLQVELDASGANSRINAGGTTTIEGGTVQVLARNGAYDPTTRYTLISSTGGVTGTFSGTTTNFAFLDAALSYDPNTVFLDLTRNATEFQNVGRTRNQRAVGNVIDGFDFGNPIFDAVVLQTEDGARAAFDQLSGEIHADIASVAYSQAEIIRRAILDRARAMTETEAPIAPTAYAEEAKAPTPYAEKTEARGYTGWGTGFGSWGNTDSDGNAAKLDRNLGGFILGVDGGWNGWNIGVAGGYSKSEFDVDDRLSSGEIDQVFGAIYASTAIDAWRVRGGVTFGANDIETTRRVPLLGETLEADYDGSTIQGFGEAGYRFDFERGMLEPFAGLAGVHIHSDSFTEDGGVAALSGDEEDDDLGVTTLGVRGETTFSASLPFSVNGLLAWQHAFGDVNPERLLAFRSGGAGFEVGGVPIDRDALLVQAGVGFNVASWASLDISYTGTIGEDAEDHGVKGRLDVKF